MDLKVVGACINFMHLNVCVGIYAARSATPRWSQWSSHRIGSWASCTPSTSSWRRTLSTLWRLIAWLERLSSPPAAPSRPTSRPANTLWPWPPRITGTHGLSSRKPYRTTSSTGSLRNCMNEINLHNSTEVLCCGWYVYYGFFFSIGHQYVFHGCVGGSVRIYQRTNKQHIEDTYMLRREWNVLPCLQILWSPSHSIVT